MESYKKNQNCRRIHHFKKLLIFKNRKKEQVGKDQEKAQSEKHSHSKNRGGKKKKLTIRYLYHETYRIQLNMSKDILWEKAIILVI